MWNPLQGWWKKTTPEPELQRKLALLQGQLPSPVFWLFGKTQTGKTSLIKFLTGAEHAEIGQGFRPCTKFSRIYQFPTEEAPLLSFLDTRGLDEPNYDPAEDIASFHSKAQAVLVTVKLLDHAQENIVQHLRTLRQAEPTRPVVLVVTCLHEAYPQQQHVEPYPYADRSPHAAPSVADSATDLEKSLHTQLVRFAGLVDHVVLLDLTPAEEGFRDPNYGGAELKKVLLRILPEAYRQTLLGLEHALHEWQDAHMQRVLPHIWSYSLLAGASSVVPLPWVDTLLLRNVQKRMINHLAQQLGQPQAAAKFIEESALFNEKPSAGSSVAAGLRYLPIITPLAKMLGKQVAKKGLKFLPFFGPVAAAAHAGASTFALGKAFCYSLSAQSGKTPSAEELRRYYDEQLQRASQAWQQLPPEAQENRS